MKRILKYPLQLTGSQSVELPAGAEILSVQEQRGMPQLWALVDPDEPGELVEIVCYGTGQEIEAEHPLSFISTEQFNSGQFVFHFFEVQKPSA